MTAPTLSLAPSGCADHHPRRNPRGRRPDIRPAAAGLRGALADALDVASGIPDGPDVGLGTALVQAIGGARDTAAAIVADLASSNPSSNALAAAKDVMRTLYRALASAWDLVRAVALARDLGCGQHRALAYADKTAHAIRRDLESALARARALEVPAAPGPNGS